MKLIYPILIVLLATTQMIAQSDSLLILRDSIAIEQSGDYEIIDPIETMPVFPGGEDSLKTFIEQNNNWQVGQETIVGKVLIAFIVERDGSITNIEIVRGLHETCDQEAIRIVSAMPNWKPAEQMGIPVRSRMFLPISFDGMKGCEH